MKYLTVLFSIIYCSTIFAQDNVKAFLPDLLSEFANVRDLSLNSQRSEAYFTAQSPLGDLSVIMRMNKNETWERPMIASFSGKYKDLEPALSPDELKLFFVSDRPVHADSSSRKDFDIWYVTRESKDSKWSSPKPLNSVNTEHGEFYPSLAENGNLYFTSDRPGSKGKDDIFYCKWESNSYGPAIRLGDSINTEGYEYNAFIAPDESYIIFGAYNRADGHGSGDLYVSWKYKGEWTKARNLTDAINSPYMDYCPFVDKQGVLYLTSKRSNLAETDKKIRDTEEFLKLVNSNQNGLSKLYRCDLPNFRNL